MSGHPTKMQLNKSQQNTTPPGAAARFASDKRCISVTGDEVFGMLTAVVAIGSRLERRCRRQTVVVQVMSEFADRRLPRRFRWTLRVGQRHGRRHHRRALNA